MESDSSGPFSTLSELPIEGCQYQRMTEDNQETKSDVFG